VPDKPEGARRWIAALAKQYMDVLSEPPGVGEKRRAPRRADARWGTAFGARPFWLLFGAMPKSNPLTAGERKLCTLEEKEKIKDSGVRLATE